MSSEARIDRVTVSAYTVPLEEPESDGTLVWEATTLVLVEAGPASPAMPSRLWTRRCGT